MPLTVLPRAGEMTPSALFAEVAGLLTREDADPDRTLHLKVHARSTTAPTPLGEAARQAARLRQACLRLHRRGGIFTCVTEGVVSGAALEVALNADVHHMVAGSRLVLPGCADGYEPCAGGWSLLLRRVGPLRAAPLLLDPAGGTLEAEAARGAGLCDGILAPGASPAAASGASRSATRLVLELAERHAGNGGLTPRQARLLERASFALAFASTHPREGIEAFFSDREPRFDGAD